ncbi:MAG: hypothetical protein IJ206_08865 [Oscillospiraceae bacterium]|nr:hypothetical protein [Oscillospiraceae bacterium]
MLRHRAIDPLWPFLGFLLLAGVMYSFETSFSSFGRTVLFCLENVIYMGLLLFWTQSLRERLLPSLARQSMLAAAGFMIAFLLIRIIKYRVLPSDSVLIRYAWYCFYIPLLMIPTLFFTSCVGVLRRDHPGRFFPLIFLPPLLLAAGILTNDLHHLAFMPFPGVDPFLGDVGNYAYGIVYYAVCVWISLTVAGGVAMLVRFSQWTENRIAAILPLCFLLMIPVSVYLRALLRTHTPRWPFADPEAMIFCLLGVFESCIRLRLIPHNDNYGAFFENLQAPAIITNQDFVPIYRTATPVAAEQADLPKALNSTVYIREGVRLSGMDIPGGHVFWEVDERELHRMNQQLEDANEMIATETELIQAEAKLKEEIARVESRGRIYRRIAEEMYPTQKRIGELLSAARPGEDSFPDMIASVALLNAYVKRKSNLLLLSDEAETVDSRELYLALNESARYLRYRGVEASVQDLSAGEIPCGAALSLYDTFEILTEALLPEITQLMISLSDGGLRLTSDLSGIPALPETPLPVTALVDEGLLYLTVSPGKGGAA